MVNEQVKRGALGLAAAVVVGVLSFWLAWKLSVQEPEAPRVASEQGKHPVQREPVSVPMAAIKPTGEKLSGAPSAVVLPSAGGPKNVGVDLPTATVTIQTKRFVADQAAVVDPVEQASSQNAVKKEPVPVATVLIPAEVSRAPASASAPLALDSGESRAPGLPTALTSERSHGQEAPPEPAIIAAKALPRIAGGSALAVVPAADARPSEVDAPQATVPPPALAEAVVPGPVGAAGTASLATIPAVRLDAPQARVTVDASLDHGAEVPRQDAVPTAQVGLPVAGGNPAMAVIAVPDVKSAPVPGTATLESPSVGTRASVMTASTELPELSRSSSGADASLAEVAEGAGGRAFYTADLSPEAHMADSHLQAASVGVRESARPQTAASVASISVSGASAAPLTTAAMNRGATSPVDTGRVEAQSVGEIALALVPPELPSMCLRSLSLAPLAHSWLPIYADAPRGMAPPFQAPEPAIGGDLLPDHPLMVARSYPATEPALGDWLERWVAGLQGGPLHPVQTAGNRAEVLSELTALLARSSLTCTQLYEIGRGIGWVEGELVATRCSSFAWAGGTNAAAVAFYRAAVAAAERELRPLPVGNPSAAAILHALSRMAGFWEIQDFLNLERVYRLIKEHTVQETLIALSAEFLQAECLYEEGRGAEKQPSITSADICRAMLNRAGVQKLPRATQAHIQLLIAYALYQGSMFTEAVQHFQIAARDGGSSVSAARPVSIIALARAGRSQDAQHEYAVWLAEANPTSTLAEYVSRQISEARR